MTRETISRRRFLKAAGLGAAALALPPRLDAAGAPRGKPNIVFILIDDQRWDVMACAAHPYVKSPNLDRLAREGAMFTRAFVTTSLCSPSRASFLTGRYAHGHGVPTNAGRDPDPQWPTFPALLRTAGYETAFVGKWHMAGHNRPRPGFDHWVSFRGQGNYTRNTLNVNGETVESKKYVTDDLTDRAVEWLRRKRTRPFMLYLSHKAVHANFTPAPRHADLYADVTMALNTRKDDRLDTKVRWGRYFPENTWQKDLRRYMQTLRAVDDGVGKVLDTLDSLGLADTTMVIFTSDNGYFHGEHRLWDKRAAYEPSIRIPMLVRYPPLVRPGARIDALVLNIDLAPTLLDLAGAETPETMQGRSWLPLARGDTAAGRRTSFLYEYFREGDPRFNRPSVLAVRTARYKYITYPDREGAPVELYDLQTDPEELTNLAPDAKHKETLARLAAELESQKKATGFRWPESVNREDRGK